MDRHHPKGPSEVERQVERLLADSQSFRHLDGRTQAALTESLARITGYLADGNGRQRLAGQLAPPTPRGRPVPPGAAGTAPVTPGQPAPATAPAPAPANSAPSQSAVGRVGEVSRATLSAINFPEFVASLIKGTFQAIVDASIQQ